jgi:uncharacterized tellurite resistance protein B-like protein
VAEFSREVDAALRKLAFHFASRLPQDRRIARRVLAHLNEIIERDSEAAEKREQVGRDAARLIAVSPDDRAA